MVEGTWKLAAGTIAGEPVPEEGFLGTVLELRDGRYTYKTTEHGTYATNTDVTPHTIDVTGDESTPAPGVSVPAIYKVEGDTMTVCYDLDFTSYPTSFESTPGTNHFLAVWKRV
ncbi:MAG: TIGR03067 domain-containing protein [Phycisphaerales bacterium JB043]